MVVFIPGFQMIAQVRFKKTAHGGSQCSNGLLGRTGRDTNTGSFYFRLFFSHSGSPEQNILEF
jgi:hypothetical protein